MNAPKKIWLADLGYKYEVWFDSVGSDLCTPYIREDLVDALVETLVETLKAVVRYAGNNGDDYLADQIRAALKKLEESHE